MNSETTEHKRLAEHHSMRVNWKKWGPYLSERAWGTVREDYSEEGQAWDYFPFTQAQSRAYRWNEDGLLGFSDRDQYFCFCLSLWNEKDPILKERIFGLSGWQGNHGEDVKDYYYYLDSSPTHSYVKMLYKYPQKAFPYNQLIETNQQRSAHEPEYELVDTGIFNDNRYFDIFVEYAKNSPGDILIKIEAVNRASEAASLHMLPTLWFRNIWSWGYPNGPMGDVLGKPQINLAARQDNAMHVNHPTLGKYWVYYEKNADVLFTENETNLQQLYGVPNAGPYVKDGIQRYVIQKDQTAVNPHLTGTKAAIHYTETLEGGASAVWRIRISHVELKKPFEDFDDIFAQRKQDCDEFYQELQRHQANPELSMIQRQAFAGLLCSKQLYYYDVGQWLTGDVNMPASTARGKIRNAEWEHLVNFDIISMPDKWEYPWYASWDLAFHAIPFALVDPDFAKRQLSLMTREWYMHPNGQLPAYEWNFSDVNPPVHAWAAWRVYKIDAKRTGKKDRNFIQGIFNKLLLNFTWWVNRKDTEGKNVFQGGFLGLDNISIFDRSQPLPVGGHIDQSDGTAWMGFYSLVMMKIALELAEDNPVWQDTATKFFEHFLRIAGAMVRMGDDGHGLWNEEDGFFYDIVHTPEKHLRIPIKVRSLVGLMPILAAETLDDELLKAMPIFSRRMEWFMGKWPTLAEGMACIYHPGVENRRLMSILTRDKLVKILRYMLDEEEFLSPYGIRSLSKYHLKHPFKLDIEDMHYSINYQPGESETKLFGGNSNWRGPVWFPLNFLIIEALQKYDHYFGEDLKVEFPTRSGNYITLGQVAEELSNRLIALFKRNEKNERPFHGSQRLFQENPEWRDYLLFNEFFHGDTGQGLGASHQTGWTGLIAKLIQQMSNQ